MRKILVSAAIAAVASSFVSTGAEAGPRRHSYTATPPAAAEATPYYGGPPGLTPADRAKSGWIDGASPYNPEGSSNPQVPNNS